MAVPRLHRAVPAIAELGPFDKGQRYWRGNDPELDIVARSVATANMLVGEAKWNAVGPREGAPAPTLGSLPTGNAAVHTFLFTPDSPAPGDHTAGTVIDARMVLDALR